MSERRSAWLSSLVVFGLLVGVLLASTACYTEASLSTGVVSAATPEAANAGVEILNAGGNAIDAAVAVSFALAVTEPAMSGLGGGTQILLHSRGKDPVVINGTSYSPATTPTNASRSDLVGHRATTVPSTVRTLDYAWRNHGSGKIAWSELLRPAIRYAEEGFPVGPFRHRVWLRHVEHLRSNEAAKQLFLEANGQAPAVGKIWKQLALAETLRRLAKHGADDFYNGEIAQEMAADIAQNGGWITLQDLQNCPQPVELPPLKGSYRDWDILTLPPPGGGWVVLQILNLLEQSLAEDLALDAPARAIRVADALHLAHQSRRAQPVRDLTNYQEEVSGKISKERAKSLLATNRPESGETTHFSVADASGMAVSVTASINAYFGARVASPKLGVLYNSYMHEFETGDPEHPFAIRPNAMPYSSMSPTIVSKDGQAHLILGSPGSSRIISAVAQVIQLWVDTGLGVEKAVAAKRLHVVPDHNLYLESGDLFDGLSELAAPKGYVLRDPRKDLVTGDWNPYFGGVHAIALENGAWIGAADPRRDGAVRRATP